MRNEMNLDKIQETPMASIGRRPDEYESRLDEPLAYAEAAAYDLLKEYHIAARWCGRNGLHDAACNRMVFAFGWRNWAAWDHLVGTA